MDGQIAYRGLPGIVVGVVSDQQLVWAKGFGYADIQAKIEGIYQATFDLIASFADEP